MLSRLSLKVLGAVLAVMFIIAVLDYLMQRLMFMLKMRMSRTELKEEYKQSEGDPQIKQKIRQIRSERARRRMMANVPKADVVITNRITMPSRSNTSRRKCPPRWWWRSALI